ncbi:MAG: flavodoxin [Lachnospiraceae bacterium]|nr:flavodoxin [Lachnospiraceae bacterium]
MRRTISLLLSFTMIFVLAACGRSVATEEQEEMKSAVQKTEESSETSQIVTEEKKQETEKQPNTETELSESVSASARGQEKDVSTRTLVVYFSCTGTTELIAEYVTEILGADIYEIIPENPYTEADLAYYTNGRADQEQDDPDVRPAISGSVENIDDYDTIILGYPIWHGQAPRIISTFLESYDFSGKTIIPFCTSHSSGIGSSASNLHALCSESTEWADGKRFEGGASKESVEDWIEETGIE